MVKPNEPSFMQKLQRQSIYDFVHSDEATRLDSNSQRCVCAMVDGVKVKHPDRIWDMTTWHEKHIVFVQSDVIKTYQENYPTFKVPSPSSLCRHYCKCVINPSSDSSVEIIKSSLCNYLTAIFKKITHNKDLSTKLSNCTCPLHSKPKEKWLTLLNAPTEQFTWSTCWLRVGNLTLAINNIIPIIVLIVHALIAVHQLSTWIVALF